ncbi:MAG: TetR/AcrR family transcriptional regulator [Planctomycetes bacterium]|nr:TetR/AcrR family transcriptional regulator [Planctomycetota bacterium]
MKRQERIKEIKARRYQEILDAATGIFARHGYHLTDVEVIADKLGVGKGTIYRYFPTKEKLFTAIMEQMMHQLAGIIAAKAQGISNPLERLRAVIRGHMEFFEKNMHILEIFVHYRSEYKEKAREIYMRHYSRGFKRTQALVHECIDKGLIKAPSLPRPPMLHRGTQAGAKLCASILIDICYGILFTTFLGASKRVFREKGRYLEELLLCGDKKMCDV